MADLALPKGAVPVGDDGQLPLPKGAVPVGQEEPGYLKRAISEFPHDVAEAFGEGRQVAKSGLEGAFSDPMTGLSPDAIAKYMLGGVMELNSPITGALKAFAGDPVRRMFPKGSKAGDFVGNVVEDAGALVGGAGLAKGAQAVGKGVSGAAEVAGRLKPGATKGAQELVSGVGQASDASVLGSKMHRDLTGKINALVKERRATASKLKADYFAQGIAKEKEIADAYRADLSTFLKAKARDLSPEQKKLITDSAAHLGKDPSIEAIETERRRLADIASGSTEGYDAIQKLFAGSLASNLRVQISRAVPAADKFLKSYAEMSEPINMFEDTALGKRITKGASDFLPDQPYYDPATLPKAFFKTKQSVNTLKTLSGDEKFVDAAAGEFAATELKDLGATQARAWATKNKEWLDEVPQVQYDVEKYVKNLEKVSHTQERALAALKTGAIGGGIGAGLATGYHSLASLLGL